jgi:hypothetical protein
MKVGRYFQDAGELGPGQAGWGGFRPQPILRKRSVVAGARRPGRDVRDAVRRRPPGPPQAARALAAARRRRQNARPRTAAPAQAA